MSNSLGGSVFASPQGYIYSISQVVTHQLVLYSKEKVSDSRLGFQASLASKRRSDACRRQEESSRRGTFHSQVFKKRSAAKFSKFATIA